MSRHFRVIPAFRCHSKVVPASSSSHFEPITSFHPEPLSSSVILKSSRHFFVILNHPMPSLRCPVIPMSFQHSSVIRKSSHHPQVISSPSHHSTLIPCHPLSFRSHPVISLSSYVILLHPCVVTSFPCHSQASEADTSWSAKKHPSHRHSALGWTWTDFG